MKTITLEINSLSKDCVCVKADFPDEATIREVLEGLSTALKGFQDKVKYKFMLDVGVDVSAFVKENPEYGAFTIKQLYHKD